MKLLPQLPLHRWSPGQYLPAATHSTSEAFAQRQRERMREAQAQQANVRTIGKRKVG